MNETGGGRVMGSLCSQVHTALYLMGSGEKNHVFFFTLIGKCAQQKEDEEKRKKNDGKRNGKTKNRIEITTNFTLCMIRYNLTSKRYVYDL